MLDPVNTTSAVQRDTARKSPRTRAAIIAPIDDIHPVIRIAHRQRGKLNITRRIILDHEIVYAVRGQGVYRASGREYSFRANDVFIIQPFVPHEIEHHGDGACEHIAVHFDFASDIPPRGNSLADRRPYVVSLTGGLALPEAPFRAPATVHERLVSIIADRAETDSLSTLTASATLALVLAQLLREYGTARLPVSDGVHAVRIKKVIDFIDTHFALPLTVSELAETAALSPSRFNTLFRQFTGLTPMDYVQRKRITVARALLADITLSVKQVAANVGFDDPLHFSRVFRNIDGLSPTQYRAAAVTTRELP
ncbi:MAG TPA: AraC family transcriptional regulator [Capsulimonadaceae bacterium]|jgi:AraC-like DNA-binding protein